MSWFKSAVTKAVEAGGNAVFEVTRAVEAKGNAVVRNAVNAKIFHDRIASRSTRNFKQTVKRLAELSVTTKGVERVQLLRRWLVALKETIRVYEDSTDSKNSAKFKYSPTKPTVELYVDPDNGGEPMDFYDVFLCSEALEGMTLSLIIEAPNDEEVSLLLEIFGLCLVGGREVHEATVRSILILAKDFSGFEEEVLVKREELLHFAQGAIGGLKVNVAIKRIDSEVSDIQKKLVELKNSENSVSSPAKSSQETTEPTEEKIKESMENFQLCSKLEALLLRKKLLNSGDSPEIHAQKVDKLKVSAESLHGSTSKAEKRIQEHRMQKEEALNFRISRTTEVGQLEKDLESELRSLEEKKLEIEAELQKVTSSLTVTKARLRNAREEREHFDQASNQILDHFNAKEDELHRSVASYKTEASACNAFIAFMEAAWEFNCSYKEQKEKQVSDELKKHEEYFIDLAVLLLSAYKDKLRPVLTDIRKHADSIKGSQIVTGMDGGNLKADKGRKHLEEEYLELEEKIIILFDVVDSISKPFISRDVHDASIVIIKGDHRIQELWNSLVNMKGEYETLERPLLEIERPEKTAKQLPPRSSSARMQSPREKYNTKSPKIGKTLSLRLISAVPDIRTTLEKGARTPEVLSKYRMTLDEDSREGSVIDEIDWEFDDFMTPGAMASPLPRLSVEHTSSPLAKMAAERATSPLAKLSAEYTSSPLAKLSAEQAKL
ncbi:Centrosomal protein of 135 kDa-like protein [Heracleum sosnowskyi]|uniref:Centrosomal protein of 135 kDa-like protein n=1 Tax=Heracleum sosnowskyi TaxID=360622 RepID=A0AAD8JFL5_9APIA|nr:Centrosomal protein of 135 kDa-like protein [Heracleum sosnowskyi]